MQEYQFYLMMGALFTIVSALHKENFPLFVLYTVISVFSFGVSIFVQIIALFKG